MGDTWIRGVVVGVDVGVVFVALIAISGKSPARLLASDSIRLSLAPTGHEVGCTLLSRSSLLLFVHAGVFSVTNERSLLSIPLLFFAINPPTAQGTFG